jgi:hypothetical protein
MDYQPMSIARLAVLIAAEPEFDARWRLVVEFLKEYHQEPSGERQRLLADMPEAVGDERWDVLFAGLAEHLAMRDGQDAPPWSTSRGLRRFWFPFDTPGARAGSGACPGRFPQARRVRCRLRNRRGVSEASPLLDRRPGSGSCSRTFSPAREDRRGDAAQRSWAVERLIGLCS